jgi:hypothetical protein
MPVVVGHDLDSFLEAYQVNENRNSRTIIEIRHVARKFDDEWALTCILSSETRLLSSVLSSKYFRTGFYFVASFLVLSALVSTYVAINSSYVKGRYFRFGLKDPYPDCIAELESIVFQYEEKTCEWPSDSYNVSSQAGKLTFAFKDVVGIAGW